MIKVHGFLIVCSRFRALLALVMLFFVSPALGIGPQDLLAPVTESIEIEVVDSLGAPVDGAVAYWFNEGKARKLKTQGSRLIDVPNRGILVAEKSGYQYSGLIVTSESSQLKMLKTDEAGREFKTQRIPLSRELKEQLLRQIQDQLLDELNDNPRDQRKLATGLPLLASLSVDRAQEFLDENNVPPMVVPMVQKAMVAKLATSDFERAIEIADSVDTPEFRSMVLFEILEKLPSKVPNSRPLKSNW